MGFSACKQDETDAQFTYLAEDTESFCICQLFHRYVVTAGMVMPGITSCGVQVRLLVMLAISKGGIYYNKKDKIAWPTSGSVAQWAAANTQRSRFLTFRQRYDPVNLCF